MDRKLIYIIKICILLIAIPSCKQSNSKIISKLPNKVEISEKKDEKKVQTPRSLSSTQAIDFFGLKLYGKYNDLIQQLYNLPILSLIERRDTMIKEHNDVMSFSHTVEFCGVPCGMNVRYRMNPEDEMSVHDLCFITSQTDDEIIHKFVSVLTKYYGVPDISDEKEDSYHWYLPSGLCVRARHMHAPDRGWTVFFHY